MASYDICKDVDVSPVMPSNITFAYCSLSYDLTTSWGNKDNEDDDDSNDDGDGDGDEAEADEADEADEDEDIKLPAGPAEGPIWDWPKPFLKL